MIGKLKRSSIPISVIHLGILVKFVDFVNGGFRIISASLLMDNFINCYCGSIH